MMVVNLALQHKAEVCMWCKAVVIRAVLKFLSCSTAPCDDDDGF